MKKLLLLLVVVLLAGPAGWACKCRKLTPIEQRYKTYDAVISATMLKKEIVVGTKTDSLLLRTYRQEGWGVIVIPDFPDDAWPFAKCTLKLKRSFKGATGDTTVIVSTGLGGGDCGVEFEISKTYLIYADGEHNGFFTDRCSGTHEYNEAEAAVLEKLQRQAHPLKPAARKRAKGQRKATSK